MAGALDALAPYVKKLIVDMAQEEVPVLLGISSEITKLEDSMEGLKAFLKVAERRRITDTSVQRWSTKLKNARRQTSLHCVCKAVTVEYNGSLILLWKHGTACSSVNRNFPSVVELDVSLCPKPKRATGLSRSHKISILRCLNLQVLQGVPTLDIYNRLSHAQKGSRLQKIKIIGCPNEQMLKGVPSLDSMR
ncbi:unnamed protein product [Miscanthus lutarioriparius]|uniref:Disease resistance N-terminal domain-containing protein n=1 Tax=Miscanthus lutarioriparius TaxID=422564 RepID=A0A811QB36_9POAL|nr:unnamed protein product [Miscanthus lutarioriparius]